MPNSESGEDFVDVVILCKFFLFRCSWFLVVLYCWLFIFIAVVFLSVIRIIMLSLALLLIALFAAIDFVFLFSVVVLCYYLICFFVTMSPRSTTCVSHGGQLLSFRASPRRNHITHIHTASLDYTVTTPSARWNLRVSTPYRKHSRFNFMFMFSSRISSTINDIEVCV